MMLRNVILQLPNFSEQITHSEILQDLLRLVSACDGTKKPPQRKPYGDRAAVSREKWKQDSSICLHWAEAAKFFFWISGAISNLTITHNSDLTEISGALSKLNTVVTSCRELQLLPQSESVHSLNQCSYREALNLLLDRLCAVMHLVSMVNPCTQTNESELTESFNNTSQIVGHLVLGNINQIEPELLARLTQQLVNELRERRSTMDPCQSVTIYATLSHLIYVHSIWDKLQDGAGTTNDAPNQQPSIDFLAQDPSSYESVLDAFVDGLRRCDPYLLRTVAQGSDADRSMTNRQVVLSCLNGLAQLLHRRSPKPNAARSPSVVRALWPHVLLFGRQYGTNKRAVGAHEGTAACDTGSGHSSPSSIPTTSDEESASSPTLGNSLQDIDCSHPRPYSYNSSCNARATQSQPGVIYSSSSEDEANASGLWLGTAGAIASGLLTGSPSGTPVRVCNRRKQDATGFHMKGTHGASSRSHPSGFTSQLKSYALSVFCLKRLLDGCRSPLALDLWPSLMCGDGWAGISTRATDASCSRPDQPADLSDVGRATAGPTPDLLTLIYRTSDMRIRKMLVEVLLSLLASVGKRFAIAEDLTPHSASFVPYSVRLAVELRHLHRRLMLALYSEKSIVLRGLLLKALTTLVLITPYARLQSGLLTSLLPGLHHLLHLTGTHTRLVDLRAGCLNLLGCILGRVPGPLLEVCQILSDDIGSTQTPGNPWNSSKLVGSSSISRVQPDLNWSNPSCDRPRGPDYWSGAQVQDPFQPCWLVQVCLRLIHPDVSSFAWDSTRQPTGAELADPASGTGQSPATGDFPSTRQFQPPPVRVQALTVLRNMVPNYAAFLRPSLPLIKKTLLFCLQDCNKNKLLWSPALKFLLVFLPFLQANASEALTSTTAGSETLAWWRDFIPPIVHILRNSKETSERSYCCKVLALLDTNSLENIQREEKSNNLIELIIESLQLVVDEDDELLQARGLRTLAALLVLKPLQTNLSLLVYIINRAPIIWNRSTNQSVGLDVAWSVANCLEVIVAHRVGLISHGSQWSAVLHELGTAGLDWINLVRTCCDLCMLNPTESNNVAGGDTTQKDCSERLLSIAKAEEAHAVDSIDRRSAGAAHGTDAAKTPDAHRSENGARALGYLLRILSPGLIRDQQVISQLFESICEAMITNQASSAEKIRWNANFAVGHLFQNTDLWQWLYDQWSNTAFQEATRGTVIVDPLASLETAGLMAKLIRHLCRTFGWDKYFKARVYAANSLLGLFVPQSSMRSNNPLRTLHSQLAHTNLEPDQYLEFTILNSAFHIIRTVHEGTALAPCCVEQLESSRLTPGNSYVAGAHLSEGQYRQQCLHLATVLLFYSLASWLQNRPDQDSLTLLDDSLGNNWLDPVVLSHVAGRLWNCAIHSACTASSECQPDTIYPRPMIVSHLLELADTTMPAKRLQQAVRLFQTRVAHLSWPVGPAIQQLIDLAHTAEHMPDNTLLCVGEGWRSLNELQKTSIPGTISPDRSDISKFRQIYD